MIRCALDGAPSPTPDDPPAAPCLTHRRATTLRGGSADACRVPHPVARSGSAPARSLRLRGHGR